jgi:molybdopterin converting factor small subunit
MRSTTSDPGLVTVTVRLYSILRHREGKIVDRLELALPVQSRLGDVLERLQIDPELEVILAVNSEVANEDARLLDGDLVSIIPAVAGGAVGVCSLR